MVLRAETELDNCSSWNLIVAPILAKTGTAYLPQTCLATRRSQAPCGTCSWNCNWCSSDPLPARDALQRFQRCLLCLSLVFYFLHYKFPPEHTEREPNHLLVAVHVDVAHSLADWDQVDSLAWASVSTNAYAVVPPPSCAPPRWLHVAPESSPPFCWAPWNSWTPCRRAYGDRSTGMSIEWA